jgi:broad specificity phosphatase PhoE
MNVESARLVQPTGGETTLYLIRHGQTMANSLSQYAGSWDVELNDTGRRQADILAECLRDTAFDAAVSSQLSRARDTAEAILRFHAGIMLEVDRDLAEWDFGELEGKQFETLVRNYPELARQLKDPNATIVTWPGGESNLDFARRVERGVLRLLTRYNRHHVAVVTHGGVISTLMLRLLGSATREDFFRYSPSNCSISEIRVTGGGTTILRWNDVQHLEAEGVHDDPFITAGRAADRTSGRGEGA